MAGHIKLGETVKKRVEDIRVGKIIKDSVGDMFILTDHIKSMSSEVLICDLENGHTKWVDFASMFEIVTVPVTLAP